MEKFTCAQRVLIVKTFYQSGESCAATVRRLRGTLGRNEAPNESTVRRLMKKFEETGSVVDLKSPGRRRSARTEQNIEVVRDSVAVSPAKSIRRRSQQLRLRCSSVRRILRYDLKCHPYKIQLTQQLKVADHQKRRQFVDWVLRNSQEDENFAMNIIFSDEAHFQLNGFVNKQNCRIWGSENPRMIKEREMYPQRVTVWCGFWSGGVIGPYFFEDQEGQAVTVNGDRYRKMIREFLWPHLDNIDIDQLWFQQDGATCHAARETIVLLRGRFQDRVISRNSDHQWPPRSCDLTPCDFYLWGYLKSLVYANKPRTINDLKEEIRRVVGQIEVETCRAVMANFMDRVVACQRSRGGHMHDIIFHT